MLELRLLPERKALLPTPTFSKASMALPHSLCHSGIPSLLCLSTETLHLQAANPWSGLDLLRTALYLSDQDGETPALEVRKLIKQGESHQSSY